MITPLTLELHSALTSDLPGSERRRSAVNSLVLNKLPAWDDDERQWELDDAGDTCVRASDRRV